MTCSFVGFSGIVNVIPLNVISIGAGVSSSLSQDWKRQSSSNEARICQSLYDFILFGFLVIK
jgi:hypothetical protein